MKNNKTNHQSGVAAASVFSQTYFHGTKADLSPGDFIETGIKSNYGQKNAAKYIYLTATLDAAIWGAELAAGNAPERIYLVEPTGAIEDDPNVTDKKFPGNPTMSYRSKHPFKVVGEVVNWQGHTPVQVKTIKKIIQDPNRSVTYKQLAKKYSVSEMTLYRIRSGENWGAV